MTDQSLIDLLKTSRSDRAFLKLYEHYPMAEKMIRTHGGTRYEARDIYQEALIILYSRVNKTGFRLTAKLSTYLFSVCRFLWMNELKKKQKLPTSGFDEIFDIGFEDDMNEAHEKESKLKQAEEAIASLGEKCRQLLQLFYFNNMSMSSIAKKMGYNSENTAKNQKYKCIEQAKKRLN